MITHNNFNYFITYILFSCIGHEEIVLQFQQTLAPYFTFNSHDCLTYIYITAYDRKISTYQGLNNKMIC
jgi:hypothetical protein